jgi:pyruvate/2-oxoglutarate dehydrogenase complex dihydrolipoamide acyltransferase (E2) component
MRAAISPFPAERAHTYAFLRDARNTAHVYLVAEIDATRLKAARAASGDAISYISYVVKAAADVIATCAEARGSLSDGLRPRIATLDGVIAKILFDKRINGRRCVVSGTVEAPDRASLAVIQSQIEDYKEAEVEKGGPFGALWKLQRLPLALVRFVYGAVLREPRRRARFQGTFSVTSVGHGPVRAILPMIATTIGLGMGRIIETPVARDGQVAIVPILTLSLTFDHRVLDGALATDLLAAIKQRLENWED